MIEFEIEITPEYRRLLASAEKAFEDDREEEYYLTDRNWGWRVFPNFRGFKLLTDAGLMEGALSKDDSMQRITRLGIDTLNAIRKSERAIYGNDVQQRIPAVNKRFQQDELCREGFELKTPEIDVFDEPPLTDDDTEQIIPLAYSNDQIELMELRRQLAIIYNDLRIGAYARMLVKRAGEQNEQSN